MDNTIIYHHQKIKIGDGVNTAVERRCTTYASHPFGFYLANKLNIYLKFFVNLLSTNTHTPLVRQTNQVAKRRKSYIYLFI